MDSQERRKEAIIKSFKKWTEENITEEMPAIGVFFTAMTISLYELYEIDQPERVDKLVREISASAKAGARIEIH